MCFPVSHLFSLLLCDRENQLNQEGFGDSKLFDFFGWHHLHEQMAKHVTGLEGDSKIKKIQEKKKRERERQTERECSGKVNRQVSVPGLLCDETLMAVLVIATLGIQSCPHQRCTVCSAGSLLSIANRHTPSLRLF